MANIFGGVEPPSWLQAIAKPIDTALTGRVLGTALGGAVKGFSEHIPFEEGVAETRLAQADPMWKLKAEAHKAQMVTDAARAQTAFTAAKAQQAEQAAWMQDAPDVIPWLMADPEKRKELPTPAVNSKAGLSAVMQVQNRDENYELRKANQQAMTDFRKAQVENSSLSAKVNLDNAKRFNQTLATVNDPAEQRAILSLTKSGVPTPEAWERLTAAPKTETKKAQSPLGKLEADRQAAVDANHPPEVIAAYDAAIKKATETGGLYSDKPEVIDMGGKKFLKWGKQLRDLSTASAGDRAQIGLLTDRIKKLQDELIKNPESDDPDNKKAKARPDSLTNQLLDARKRFNKFFTDKPAVAAGAGTPAPSTSGTNSPVKYFNPATGETQDTPP